MDRDGAGCLEVVDENVGEQDWKAGGKSQPTNPRYQIDGRECSNIVPGNLRVVKPHLDTSVKKSAKQEVRHNLSGTWVETDETKTVSFCTDMGQKMGEHDIA